MTNDEIILLSKGITESLYLFLLLVVGFYFGFLWGRAFGDDDWTGTLSHTKTLKSPYDYFVHLKHSHHDKSGLQRMLRGLWPFQGSL